MDEEFAVKDIVVVDTSLFAAVEKYKNLSLDNKEKFNKLLRDNKFYYL